jgi:hypothetical protein
VKASGSSRTQSFGDDQDDKSNRRSDHSKASGGKGKAKDKQR